MEKLLLDMTLVLSPIGGEAFSTQPLRVLIIGTSSLISRAPGVCCYIFVLGPISAGAIRPWQFRLHVN